MKRRADSSDDAGASPPRRPPRVGSNNSTRQSSDGIASLRPSSAASVTAKNGPAIVPNRQVPFPHHDEVEPDKAFEDSKTAGRQNTKQDEKDSLVESDRPSFFPNDVEASNGQESARPGAFQITGPGGSSTEHGTVIWDDGQNEIVPDLMTVTEQGHTHDTPVSARLVQAEKVPDLVLAVANPEEEERHRDAAVFLCGIRCCSIQEDLSERSRSRKRMYMLFGAISIVIVICVVGLSVGLSGNSSSSSSAVDSTSEGSTAAPGNNMETVPPSMSNAGSVAITEPSMAPSIVGSDTPTGFPTFSPAIRPTISPTRRPTNSPTKRPTSAPTKETRAFITALDWTNSFYGHMFDITARKDLIVVGMEVQLNTQPNKAEKLELYTKPGTYVGYTTDSFQWVPLGGGAFDVISNGLGVRTPLPDSVFSNTPIRVRAGETRSFYVTSPTDTIVTFAENKSEDGTDLFDYGQNWYYNDDMWLNVGTGIQYPFQNNGPPNTFNGQLDYVLE